MTLTWGAFVPHGGADELNGLSPADAWSVARDYAAAVDELGYDHLWTSDHLMASGGDRSGLYFEAYTLLAALSQVTSRVRLGQMVTCSAYRNAGLLAKQAAGIDVFSSGRLILGLGGGWDEGEFEAFGFGFPPARERYQRFAETLEAVTRLWSEESVDLDGEFVRLRGARCEPKPVSRPPIWTGTHGRRGLEVAARLADVANFNQPLAEFTRLSGVLAEACSKVGRTIETSVFRLADLSGGGRLREILADQGAPPEMYDEIAAQHFVGEPDDVIPRVQAFVDAGARHLVILALDSATSTTTAERFLREVVPGVVEPG